MCVFMRVSFKKIRSNPRTMFIEILKKQEHQCSRVLPVILDKRRGVFSQSVQ
jgi:hypothetical protein